MLRAIFGPSKKEIWSQIANDIGGEYIDRGFWKTDGLSYQHGEWEILLDTYTQSSGNSSTTYTRMRAPFVNKDDLRFNIYREGFFASIGKFFGMQDLEIGNRVFDDAFIVKGNHLYKLQKLFKDERIRELIHAQPRIHFQIKDDEGWFMKSYPEGTDVLLFECVGVVKDTQRLHQLFELFARTLERLVQIDSAYEDDPGISLA